MSRSVTVQFQLPGDFGRLSMPKALHARLQELLDRQDYNGKLTARERREAQALTDLVDMLTLLKLRARQASVLRRGKCEWRRDSGSASPVRPLPRRQRV